MSNRWVVVGLVMTAGLAVVHCNSTDALPPIDTEGAVGNATGGGGGGSPYEDASSTTDAGDEADQAADTATADAADASDASSDGAAD